MVTCVQSIAPITFGILHLNLKLFLISVHLMYSSLIGTIQSDTRCTIDQEVDCATSNKLASVNKCTKIPVGFSYISQHDDQEPHNQFLNIVLYIKN